MFCFQYADFENAAEIVFSVDHTKLVFVWMVCIYTYVIHTNFEDGICNPRSINKVTKIAIEIGKQLFFLKSNVKNFDFVYVFIMEVNSQ